MGGVSIELILLLALLLGNILVSGLTLLFGRKCVREVQQGHTYQSAKIITFLMHFGTGTFMSTCLLILLPQSRDLFEIHEHSQINPLSENGILNDTSHDTHHENFPMPEFLMLCGFFATFAIQEALQYIFDHCCKRKETHPRVRFCSCAKRHTECSRTFKAENPEQTLFGFEKRRNTDATDSVVHSILQQEQEQLPDLSSKLLQSSIISQPVPNYGSLAHLMDAPIEQPLPILTPQVVIANDGRVATISRPVQHKSNSPSNILLVLTLSCYGIFQGILIGQTSKTATWEKLLVDCLQQGIMTFVISCISLSEGERTLSGVCYATTISIMAPLGIGLYIGLGQKLKSIQVLLWGCAKALVCGSLLFLTFCDLMKRRQLMEFSHISKFVAFTIGAALIIILQYCSVVY